LRRDETCSQALQRSIVCALRPFVHVAANVGFPPIPWKNTRSLAQNIAS